jgi:hypothetical protein
MTNVVNPNPTLEVAAEIDAETAKLVAKSIAIDQHTRNSHGPMTAEKLVAARGPHCRHA